MNARSKLIMAIALMQSLSLLPAACLAQCLSSETAVDPFLLPINGQIAVDGGEGKGWERALQPVGDNKTARSERQAVIVVDSDFEGEDEVQENYAWKEIPDQPGKTQIDAGARFPVMISSQLSSKSAKVGDPVEARLKVDLKIGGKLIAPKGTRVIGHVSSAERARKLLHAEFSVKRWMRANGALGIQFDEIVTDKGEHLPLSAAPARTARIVKNKGEGRELGVNHLGQIATPLSIQVKHQAAHLAIRGAASAAGVFSFGIVPVAYGVVGAINPSFAFMHPVGQNVRHRRLKGFGMGLLGGLPGGFLITDSIIRGAEAVVKPGDEFLVEFKQAFTGEATTDAQMIPGASTKVRGEVVRGGKKKK